MCTYTYIHVQVPYHMTYTLQQHYPNKFQFHAQSILHHQPHFLFQMVNHCVQRPSLHQRTIYSNQSILSLHSFSFNGTWQRRTRYAAKSTDPQTCIELSAQSMVRYGCNTHHHTFFSVGGGGQNGRGGYTSSFSIVHVLLGNGRTHPKQSACYRIGSCPNGMDMATIERQVRTGTIGVGAAASVGRVGRVGGRSGGRSGGRRSGRSGGRNGGGNGGRNGRG